MNTLILPLPFQIFAYLLIFGPVWVSFVLTKPAVFMAHAKANSCRRVGTLLPVPEAHRQVHVLYSDSSETLSSYIISVSFIPTRHPRYRHITYPVG